MMAPTGGHWAPRTRRETFAMIRAWISRLTRKEHDDVSLGWRIRLGSRLASWAPPLHGIGVRLMVTGIEKQTPNLSAMERNILLRQARADVMGNQ